MHYRRLNRKLFLILLALGGVLGIAVHVVHSNQVTWTAQRLRAQATAALKENDYETAIQRLDRYLTFQPRDAEALTEYGQAHFMLGRNQRAIDAFKQVLVLDESRRAVRRQLIDLAVQAEYWTTAASHAHTLLAQTPADGTPETDQERGHLEYVLGQNHEKKRKPRFDVAAEAYGRAIEHAPNLIDAYVRRAALLRERLKQPQQADVVMTNLIQQNSTSFRAFFASGRYRQRWQLPGADADLQTARALAQEQAANLQDLDDFLVAAELAQLASDLDEARTYLTRAVEQYAADRRPYQQLARLELKANRRDEAVAILQQGLAALPGDRDLRIRLTEALIAAGKLEEAQAELASLRKQIPIDLVSYLEAHLLVQGKNWVEASQLLETIREQLAWAPDLRAEADHLLSRCYDHLGDHDQYFATLQRTIADAAKSGLRTGEARYRLGSALFAAGRIEEALAQFNQAVASGGAPPQVWIRLAEATLARALRLPAEKRSLGDEIEQYLAMAEQVLPDSVEVTLLRAEVLAVQGDQEGAEAVLRKALDKSPRIEYWAGLVALFVRRNAEPSAVRSLLDQAQRKLGDTADLRLLRARWWTTRPRADAHTALATLRKDLEKAFAAEEQPRLLAGLAEAYARIGDLRQSEQLWQQYLELQPSDVRARQVVFELLMQLGDDDAAQRAVTALRETEGEEGTYWRACAAVRHLVQVRRAVDTEGVAEARRLIGEITERRPRWARTAVLEGELAELEGRPDEAVAKYQQAIEQGEQTPRLIQRTVELLNQTRQYQKADALIAKLGEGGSGSNLLRWLNVEASLRANDFGRAEVLARAAALANPKDYRQQLWLGQVLAAGGKLNEAELALQRAVALASHLPETWITLVQLQVRRDPKKAEVTVQRAQEQVPAEQAPLTLGPCFELLGQREKAAEHYLAALGNRPNDPAVLRVVALWCARSGDPVKAETLLRKILEPAVKAPESLAAWARRTLALSVAGSDYRRFKEGMLLLDENKRRHNESPEDQRVRAILLEHVGRRHEAIQVLEDLGKSGSFTVADQFLLARLYESVGDWASADQRLAALSTSSPDPSILAWYARGLLRQGDVERARPLVAKLEKRDPAGLSTLQVRAHLLHADGQTEEVPKLFQTVLQEAKDPIVVGLVALLFEELGHLDVAENTYRSFAERTMLPEATLSLARFLARQKRVQEALDLCDQVAAQLPTETVGGVMAGIVRTGKGDPNQISRAERWIRTALDSRIKEKHPGAVSLLMALANLQDYQGRYGDAIQTYRRVLAMNPNDAAAINNFAWLAASQDRKGAVEALRLLTHAIDQLVGPSPVLLDTRASVFLALGRTDDAINDLLAAVKEAQSPIRYFHLAQAYRQAKRRQEAKEALDVAQALGLDAAQLHPLEHAAYKTMCAELGIK